MNPSLKTKPGLRVSDLVLNPFAYSDALRGPVSHGNVDDNVAERLSMILPIAIAQLDALGDPYGAIALESLYEELESLHLVA